MLSMFAIYVCPKRKSCQNVLHRLDAVLQRNVYLFTCHRQTWGSKMCKKLLPSDCNFCKSEDGNSITLNLKPEDRNICAKNARPASYLTLPIICNLQVSSFLSPVAGEKQKKLWMSRILQKKLSRKGRRSCICRWRSSVPPGLADC